MKTAYLVAVLSLILAVVSGCSGVFTTNKGGINQPDFRTGTQGVEISLLENTPPATMYENSQLAVAFELWNKGSYDFFNGVYSVSYDPSYMTLDRSAGELPELYGKSVENPIGEKRIVTLLGKTKSLPSQLERITLPLVITACYEYSTIASPAVCIDTDILNQIPANKKSCAVKSLSFSGQGAPVAVTGIVPRMYAGAGETVRPEFTITIRNSGRGFVLASNRIYEACSPDAIVAEEFNVADLKVTLSDSQLRCRPDSLKFVSGQATVVCSLEEGIDKRLGAYSAPLIIEMNYGYSTSLSKSFELKRII
jgi:hypothetical protein